jgi:HNH endonuclease
LFCLGPMKRSSPIRRYARLPRFSKKRRKRSGIPGKLGIVRLFGLDLEALHDEVFDRDEDHCQMCGIWVRREAGHWDSGHMAHIVGKGASGSDVISNVRVLCMSCHLVDCHNPKSVPSKHTGLIQSEGPIE